jgi:hypothetical protein
MTLDEAFSFSVADHPVEEVQGVLFIDGVSGDPEPIDDDRHGRQDHSGGNGEVEISGECEQRATNSCPNEWNVPSDIESPVEVGGDARVNSLVEFDLMFIDFSDLLLAL